MTTIDQQITEQFGSIIKKFPILHHGWEGDGYGYVVPDVENIETEAFTGPLITAKLILTNHSKPYEANASELRAKVIEYQNMIEETNEALRLLGE
jgi:hypothetical protein